MILTKQLDEEACSAVLRQLAISCQNFKIYVMKSFMFSYTACENNGSIQVYLASQSHLTSLSVIMPNILLLEVT